jgi:hypothetical protein
MDIRTWPCTWPCICVSEQSVKADWCVVLVDIVLVAVLKIAPPWWHTASQHHSRLSRREATSVICVAYLHTVYMQLKLEYRTVTYYSLYCIAIGKGAITV